MKIAFLLRDLEVGGLEKVTAEVATLLAQTHAVDILVLDKNTNKIPTQNCRVIEGHVSYTFIQKIFKRLNRLTLKIPQLLFYKEISFLKYEIEQNKYDFVIASDGYNSIILEAALHAVQLPHKPKALGWMHNEYEVYFNKYFKKIKRMFNHCLCSLDGIIALTTVDKIKYEKHNKNTIAISNPLTLSNPKQSSLSNKEIVFVSRLSREQKGLDFLLKIAERIKETGWTIRVVGKGVDEEWMKSEIIRRNLERTVIMHGLVTDNLEEIYASASIFISTSRWEGFGLSILEAMACGLPIVSFDNAGPREILDNGNYGLLIKKYDIIEFVQALTTLMGNKILLENFSVLSKERYGDFNTIRTSKIWEDFLSNQL